MKLTPLDIHHKEFGRSLRGYNEEQVDQFLDEVADEFERLFKENIDLSERLEAANQRVAGYQSMEATLNNTLVSAQRSAEEIVAKAGVEANTMLRDAELKSKEIIHNALQKRQVVANELVRIKQAEEEYRMRYKALLDAQMRGIAEIGLADDVTILLGETDDGVVSAVEVQTSAVVPESALEATTAFSAVEQLTAVDGPSPVAAAQEPPAAGFVQSVTLGEVESAEMPSGPVELVEPGEFELPGFDAFGERENDIDIEEID